MTESAQASDTGRVAKVINDSKVVANRGTNNGIAVGRRAILYSIGEEIIDPETQKSLGKLEMPKGTGTVTSVQPTMCIIESDRVRKGRVKKVVRRPAMAFMLDMGGEEVLETAPDDKMSFDGAEAGDYVRWI